MFVKENYRKVLEKIYLEVGEDPEYYINESFIDMLLTDYEDMEVHEIMTSIYTQYTVLKATEEVRALRELIAPRVYYRSDREEYKAMYGKEPKTFDHYPSADEEPDYHGDYSYFVTNEMIPLSGALQSKLSGQYDRNVVDTEAWFKEMAEDEEEEIPELEDLPVTAYGGFEFTFPRINWMREGGSVGQTNPVLVEMMLHEIDREGQDKVAWREAVYSFLFIQSNQMTMEGAMEDTGQWNSPSVLAFAQTYYEAPVEERQRLMNLAEDHFAMHWSAPNVDDHNAGPFSLRKHEFAHVLFDMLVFLRMFIMEYYISHDLTSQSLMHKMVQSLFRDHVSMDRLCYHAPLRFGGARYLNILNGIREDANKPLVSALTPDHRLYLPGPDLSLIEGDVFQFLINMSHVTPIEPEPDTRVRFRSNPPLKADYYLPGLEASPIKPKSSDNLSLHASQVARSYCRRVPVMSLLEEPSIPEDKADEFYGGLELRKRKWISEFVRDKENYSLREDFTPGTFSGSKILDDSVKAAVGPFRVPDYIPKYDTYDLMLESSSWFSPIDKLVTDLEIFLMDAEVIDYIYALSPIYLVGKKSYLYLFKILEFSRAFEKLRTSVTGSYFQRIVIFHVWLFRSRILLGTESPFSFKFTRIDEVY